MTAEELEAWERGESVPPPPVTSHTDSQGYGYGCRCEICVAAHRNIAERRAARERHHESPSGAEGEAMTRLVLSIFPGIDLLGRAFEEAGYCVVRGPDVIWGGEIRTFYPPAGVFDGIIGGDPCQTHSALAHLVRHNGNEPRFPDLSPEYQRIVEEAQPRWFLRENVSAAPKIAPAGYDVWSTMLVDHEVGGVQPRKRLIQFGMREGLWSEPLRSPLSLIEYVEGAAMEHIIAGPDANLSRLSASTDAARRKRHSVTCDDRAVPLKIGGSGKVKRSLVGDARQGTTGDRVRRTDAAMGGVLPIEDACEAMGLPRDFMLHSPFTKHGQRSVLGNGVPLAMGRAIASMVGRAAGEPR